MTRTMPSGPVVGLADVTWHAGGAPILAFSQFIADLGAVTTEDQTTTTSPGTTRSMGMDQNPDSGVDDRHSRLVAALAEFADLLTRCGEDHWAAWATRAHGDIARGRRTRWTRFEAASAAWAASAT